jgi:DNA-binding MarR family transcriptional regulator
MSIPTEPDPRHLVLALHRATALVDRVADGYLRPAHDIGISVFAALVTIDAVGPASQSDVARGLGVSRAAVTQRLRRLVEDGLVEVVADPGSGRANVVSTTAAGRALLSEAWAGLARSDDGLERGVDLGALQQALDTMIANAEQHLARAARQR